MPVLHLLLVAWLLPLCAICFFPLAVRLVRLLLIRARRRPPSRPMRAVFLHPDLGIGGAERLVVDAASVLQARGHSVLIVTSHHDRSRCFEETRDGTLAVAVAGAVVPRHVRGRLHVLCATVRGLAGAVWLLASEPGCDVAVVDQVAPPVALLRLAGVPVVFYCHFPDKLLATGEAAGAAGSASLLPRPRGPLALVRAAYRLPFDLLEELCTGAASAVLVNSAYTASVFAASFPLLRRLGCTPSVLHPSISLANNRLLAWPAPAEDNFTLVSLNRFERKKDLALALRALAHLRAGGGAGGGGGAAVRLVLAGGLDERLPEQVACHAELLAEAGALGLQECVELRTNVSAEERGALFARAGAVVYTPSFEHFGIVPLEAMAAGRPVIAVALGGPCESVAHGETGWLCEPTPAAFAAAYAEAAGLDAAGELCARGLAARSRVEAHFSLDAFGEALEGHLVRAARPPRAESGSGREEKKGR